MSRWIAMHCTPEREEIQRRHPNAWLLLCQIATRAKWKDCPVTGLRAGEAFVGDFRTVPIETEKAYRVAKQVLERAGIVAFRRAGRSSIATLVDSSFFSLSHSEKGGQEGGGEGGERADKGRDEGGQRAGIGAINTHRYKDTRTHGEESPAALAAEIRSAYPRQTHLRDTLAEIEAAMRRHLADDILAGTRRIATAVAGWTDAERLQFLKAPPEFFRGDHWRDDPEFWRSKQAARLETSGRKPLRTDAEIDRLLGGRAHA